MKTMKRLRLNDAHLHRMVDDTGIYQHALFDLPDAKEGYCTDDNARLMMMAAMRYEATGEEKWLDMAYRAMGFLNYAEKDGWFRNFMGFDRRFLEEKGSQDCFGRCVWCLGYITGRPALPEGLRAAADTLLRRTSLNASNLAFLRSSAYAALGFGLWDDTGHMEQMAEHLTRIATGYHGNAKPKWFWFENEMTYCNATLPHALLLGYAVFGDANLKRIGLDSLGFLLEETTRDGFFWPVGCHGWSRRGDEPALYDQQPVEACGTLLACLKAHEISDDNFFLDKATLCYEWFLGHNSAGQLMIDPESGGCYDGLTEDGPNRNQGAESLLSWYVASLALEAYGAGHDGAK